MAKPKALISGVTGQDGSYLAELLLDKGYEVHGIIRRASTFNTGRIDHIIDKLNLYHGDITDASFITGLIFKNDFDEIYHLAAQSHVRVSFDNPVFTSDVTGTGTAVILEALRLKGRKATRFYFAGSSEIFGNARAPQHEKTPMQPESPYGCAKAYGYWMTKNYRTGYGIHCSTGILFNHESIRRGETFLSRKVAKAVARIEVGIQKELVLGNLTARRDWGWAPEFVEAMWLILQQEIPDDYVIATGETHTVQEFVQEAFDYAGLDWHDYVKQDQRYFRPNEVNCLMGNPAKAKERLHWQSKIGFKEIVRKMVDYEIGALDQSHLGGSRSRFRVSATACN